MWEAVLPCLHYLPPMTPVKHATPVFGNAVEVLIHLANIRYPEVTKRKERSKLLSEILRNGVFQGMTYAGEHVAMVEKFAQESVKLVEEMGIYAVSHLSV